jgi:CDP-glycerol glycerophosphotransferase (TagB/SpsB family)
MTYWGLLRNFSRVNNKKVLLASDSSSYINGSLRGIRDELIRAHPELTIKLELKGSINAHRGAFGLHRFLLNMATANIILLDDYLPELNWLQLRKSQTVIQLWHAAGALKKVGFSRLGLPGGPETNSQLHRGYSKVVCSSEGVRNAYSEAFRISVDDVHALGLPRFSRYFDRNFSDQSRTRVSHCLGIPIRKKIVLVAPTFRGNGQKSAVSPNLSLVIAKLAGHFAGTHIFLIRDHPFTLSRKSQFHSVPVNVFDISSSALEIEELVSASDLVVTDYSSIIFEFALLGKPTILFTPDHVEYVHSRGLYYKLEEYEYGNLAFTEPELIRAIEDPRIDPDKLLALRKRHFADNTRDSASRIVKLLVEPAL